LSSAGVNSKIMFDETYDHLKIIRSTPANKSVTKIYVLPYLSFIRTASTDKKQV